MDLIRVYATPGTHGVGRRLNGDTIDRKLADLPVGPTIDLLAQIAYRADSARTVEENRELARQSLRPADADRYEAVTTTNPNVALLSPQIVLGLASRALVHCAGPYRDMGAEDIPMLTELILALGGVAEDSTDDRLVLEFTRLGLFFKLNDLDWWYELAHRLLFDVLPALDCDQEATTRDVIEQHSGLTLEIFAAFTTAVGVAITNQPHLHRFPIALSDSVISEADQLRWIDLWAIELDDTREKAERDIQGGFTWSFGAFFDRPLLRVDDRVVALRPHFVANKGTPSGLYDLVERLTRASEGDTNAWSARWGRAMESLARSLLGETLPETPILHDEAAIRAKWGKGKACDCVLLEEAWVGLDFVKRRFRTVTRTVGDLDDLQLDIRRAVVDKLLQIDASLGRGVAVEGMPNGGLMPVVVVGEPFPTNGLLLAEIDDLLAEEETLVIGHDQCHHPLVIDLAEFWKLILLSEQHGRPVNEFLKAWLRSPLGVAPFRDWLVTEGPGQPALAGRRYGAHARRTLFERDAPASELEM